MFLRKILIDPPSPEKKLYPPLSLFSEPAPVTFILSLCYVPEEDLAAGAVQVEEGALLVPVPEDALRLAPDVLQVDAPHTPCNALIHCQSSIGMHRISGIW